MAGRILCVDDEPNLLQGLERQFYKQFEIQTALGPHAGLELLRGQGPFAVVVSDFRMPGMDGIEFLSRVRELSPDSVRLMLTGQADMATTIAAVNRGHVFQFLTKPCSSDMLARAFTVALEQHRLVTAERELLEQTVRGSINVLTDILGLVNPSAFGRAQRLRRYVEIIASKLQLPDVWQYELAALLSQIGCVAIPPDVLDKFQAGEPLTRDEEDVLSSQFSLSRKLVAKIPRLDVIAQIIETLEQAPKTNIGHSAPIGLGAHLVRLALEFDKRITRGEAVSRAVSEIHSLREYDPRFVAALEQVHADEADGDTRRVRRSELRTGMYIASDVYTHTGLLLLAKGQEVTESVIARLESFAKTVGVAEPIMVRLTWTKLAGHAVPSGTA